MSRPGLPSGVSFVWLDLGYTLLYNLREPTYRRVLLEHGADVAEEALALAFHRLDKRFMREFPGVFGRDPRTYMPWYLGMLHHALGLRLDVCAAARRFHELVVATGGYWRAYDAARPALERLRRRGLRLGVISNWDHTARPILAHENLADLFDAVVISSEVGVEKPDERIFRLALDGAGVEAAECLYVGDNYYDDAVGSARVGMRALIINRYGADGVEEIGDQTFIRGIAEVEDHLYRTPPEAAGPSGPGSAGLSARRAGETPG